MLERLIKYIIGFSQSVPTGLSAGLLLLFCIGTGLLLSFLGLKQGMKRSAELLLLEYVFMLLFLSVLSRSPQVERVYDFVPFWSYRAVQAGKPFILTSIIANVIAFIPIGALLGCAFGKIKWWKVLLIGGAFSILIETLQFVLKRGHTEFDDVFHNVLGCVIGYGLYVAFTYVVRSVNKKRIVEV